MKTLLAIAACTLSLSVGGPIYAQGTKGPSGSGAESASKQSRDIGSGASKQEGARATTEDDTTARGTAETDTASPGGPDSMTSVAPAQPATPSTTEPGAGGNRSASGDSAGTQPRSQDDQGFR